MLDRDLEPDDEFTMVDVNLEGDEDLFDEPSDYELDKYESYYERRIYGK